VNRSGSSVPLRIVELERSEVERGRQLSQPIRASRLPVRLCNRITQGLLVRTKFHNTCFVQVASAITKLANCCNQFGQFEGVRSGSNPKFEFSNCGRTIQISNRSEVTSEVTSPLRQHYRACMVSGKSRHFSKGWGTRLAPHLCLGPVFPLKSLVIESLICLSRLCYCNYVRHPRPSPNINLIDS